jgi:hypothetical protein
MKGLVIAASMLGSVLLPLTPAISTIYREAFPTEPAKQAALAACAQDDPGFHRLIASERAQCYARQLLAPAQPDPMPRSREIVRTTAPNLSAI